MDSAMSWEGNHKGNPDITACIILLFPSRDEKPGAGDAGETKEYHTQ